MYSGRRYKPWRCCKLWWKGSQFKTAWSKWYEEVVVNDVSDVIEVNVIGEKTGVNALDKEAEVNENEIIQGEVNECKVSDA